MIPVLLAVLVAAVVGGSAALIVATLSRAPEPPPRCWACGRFIPAGYPGVAQHMQAYHAGALGPEDLADWGY